MKKKLAFTLVLAAAVLTATAFAGVGRPDAARGDTAPAGRTVTTTGHGDISATPDTATVSAGVQVTADTASAALARDSALAAKVIAALKAVGGRNLQTQQVSLSQNTNDAGKITGYTAQNSVSADVGVASAGALIDAATAAGATSIDGPTFSESNASALYDQALAAAVDDARAKAAALAKAGGFSVGQIQSVAEQSSAPQPLPFGAAAKAPAATPVEPGSQDVTADVTVSFAIS